MRVALVCHYLPPHQGGIEMVVRTLADHYAAAGHPPTLVGWGRREDAMAASTWPVTSLPGVNPLERVGVPVPLIEPVGSQRQLSELLTRVDAVHVHGLPYLASMLVLAMAAKRNLPVVATEHVGTIPYSSRALRTMQATAMRAGCAAARRGARAVTVLNDRVGETLRPAVRPVPVHKVPNGVDLALFAPADGDRRDALRQQLGLERPTVVAVGRNVAKKGLRRLVEATEGTGMDLVLVGAGTSTLAGGHVRAIERLPRDELADLYRAADALALLSEGEGLPLVVQEALASGLPVVLGDDPAVRSELPEGVVRFVPVDQPTAAREALLCAVAAPGEVRSRARREAEERWSWAEAATRYLELMGAG